MASNLTTGELMCLGVFSFYAAFFIDEQVIPWIIKVAKENVAKFNGTVIPFTKKVAKQKITKWTAAANRNKEDNKS